MAKRKSAGAKSDEGEEAGAASLWRHPRASEALFGQDAAEETFLRAFEAGSLHHAWLLTGEKGIGKATFSYRAARFLLSHSSSSAGPHAADFEIMPSSEPPHAARLEPTLSGVRAKTLAIASDQPAARQLRAGAHSSLFVLGEGQAAASIGVDEVRKLRAFLGLTSPGGWRVAIVDPANDLTIASANSLLKAIEEPPPRTVFFLIGHGAARVMPTIRSRCVKLVFRPLNTADFEKAVLAACAAGELDAPDAPALKRLHSLAKGSPGRALEFLEGGLLPLAEKLDRIASGLPRVDYTLVHSLVQSVNGAKNAQSFARLCDMIEERIESFARQALEMAPDAGQGAAWARLWQTLRQRRDEMEGLNLDKGAFLLAAFSGMEHAARKP